MSIETPLPTTLGELKRRLLELLAPVCVNSEQIQAERDLLLQHCFNLDKTQQFQLVPDTALSANGLKRLTELLEKRCEQRQPIQHLLGYSAFYGLRLSVSPDVLIPRPETEGLVEGVLKRVCNSGPLRILDLGTGSGAIAIALKKHLPHATVDAVDSSEAALLVARHNATAQGTDVTFYKGNWYTALPETSNLYDVIVSNPPYIDKKDAATLTPEVLQEPSQALFSPEAPETLYYQLIQDGFGMLAPKGIMGFELGQDVSAPLIDLLKKAPNPQFADWTLEDDYAGIPRYLWLKQH